MTEIEVEIGRTTDLRTELEDEGMGGLICHLLSARSGKSFCGKDGASGIRPGDVIQAGGSPPVSPCIVCGRSRCVPCAVAWSGDDE